MKCVILAGGGGLRLWPLSRGSYPKQFISLTNENTMFAETVLRNKAVASSFMVVTNDEYRFITEHQMEKLNIKQYELLLETVGRNTAPAIALACMRSNPEELLLVVPADHKIEKIDQYQKAIEQAKILAEQESIITFGIKPTLPHTGYGYIKYQNYDVVDFKEKPNYDTAKQYLEEGSYLWNSGMFLFRANVFLSELKKYRYDIYIACKELSDTLPKQRKVVLTKEYMMKIPSESIDYAVMEHSDKIKVIPAGFVWSDVGCLEAMADTLKPDQDGNRYPDHKIILNQNRNVSVLNTEDQLVVVNGMENTIIVNTKDALYISAYGKSSAIKKIIEENKEKYYSYFNANYKVYRPWGFYEILNDSQSNRVRRIMVYPKSRLSLHKHTFRSEHWTVVAGVATVIIGEEVYKLESKRSMDIPECTLHRLCNETEENVEIIEISLGDSITEDDIVRVEDDFDKG